MDEIIKTSERIIEDTDAFHGIEIELNHHLKSCEELMKNIRYAYFNPAGCYYNHTGPLPLSESKLVFCEKVFKLSGSKIDSLSKLVLECRSRAFGTQQSYQNDERHFAELNVVLRQLVVGDLRELEDAYDDAVELRTSLAEFRTFLQSCL
ncbi:MAG: hypothetical protein PHC51_03090 [bacterium]|nr:hypothetical protein [bacterium]